MSCLATILRYNIWKWTCHQAWGHKHNFVSKDLYKLIITIKLQIKCFKVICYFSYLRQMLLLKREWSKNFTCKFSILDIFLICLFCTIKNAAFHWRKFQCSVRTFDAAWEYIINIKLYNNFIHSPPEKKILNQFVQIISKIEIFFLKKWSFKCLNWYKTSINKTS